MKIIRNAIKKVTIDNIKYRSVIGFFSLISFIAISAEAISIKQEAIKIMTLI